MTGWRSDESGITKWHMNNAYPFKTAKKIVADLLDGRILVGHTVSQDLKFLGLTHPGHRIREIRNFDHFRKVLKQKRPELDALCLEFLDYDIDLGRHFPEDYAQLKMALFRLHMYIRQLNEI